MQNRRLDRLNTNIREISIEPHFSEHAEGSCLVKFGKTHVICTASVDEKTPAFLRNTKKGWITAEYGMLPRSTHSRMDREASRGKQSGRTMEIQRLIGRSLRAITNLTELKEKQIKLDCDVIKADGGTRTASISGAWVALFLACEYLLKKGDISSMPIKEQVAAISCGIIDNNVLLDLDYQEDSRADTDANFVLTSNGGIIEVQSTAEKKPFKNEQLIEMINLATKGCEQIFPIQKKALEIIKY